MLSILSIPVLVFGQTANHVVISEIYGGGGNSGATYNSDFIELYNPTSTDVNLSGLSVQYSAATGTGAFSGITVFPSGSVIKAHSYFLIQEQSSGSGGTALPAADLATTGTINNFNLSATAGKVALVNNSTLLSAPPTLPSAAIIDFVGYGTTTIQYEGSGPAPVPSATTSIERKASSTSTAATIAAGGSEDLQGNGYDSDNNANDFIIPTAINPQNSASPTETVSLIPTITSFTPNSPTPGSNIVLTGTNFTGATSVSFGGMAAASFTVNSATQITAKIGFGTSGNIVVTTGNGTATIAGFIMGGPPNVTYASPQAYTVGNAVSLAPVNIGGPVKAYAFIGTLNTTPQFLPLPDGLSFDTATGIISGTPTVASASNTYHISVTSNSYNPIDVSVTISVAAPAVPNLSGNSVAAKSFTANTAVTPFNFQNTGGPVYATAQNSTLCSSLGVNNLQTLGSSTNIMLATTGLRLNQFKSSSTSLTSVSSASVNIFDSSYGVIFAYNGGTDLGIINYSTGAYTSIFTNGKTAPANMGTLTTVTAGTGSLPSIYAYNGSSIFFFDSSGASSVFASNVSNVVKIVNAGGQLLAFDNTRHLIQKITASGVTAFAGGGLATGSGDGKGTTAYFTNIKDMIAANGYLYVLDGYAVRQVNLTTAQVITFAGSATSGYKAGYGTVAGFDNPTALAYDGTALLVLDGSSIRRLVAKAGYASSPVLPDGLVIDGATGTISGHLLPGVLMQLILLRRQTQQAPAQQQCILLYRVFLRLFHRSHQHLPDQMAVL